MSSQILADFLSEVGEDAHKTGLNLLQSGAKNIHAPMPYLAIESALLNPALNSSFPDEAVNNHKGWDVVFEADKITGAKHAYLRPQDNQSISWALDENGKPVYFITTAPDGTVYESILSKLLNPADPAHPKANEIEFALASAGEWWNSLKKGEFGLDQREEFKWEYLADILSNNLPLIEIASQGNWFANHLWSPFSFRPSLDSLLSQPEDSLDKLGILGYNIKAGLDIVDSSSPRRLDINGDPALQKILIELQKELWALSFAIK